MSFSTQQPLRQRGHRHTTVVSVGAERVRLTANSRDDGCLGEVFVQWGEQGAAGAGLLDAYAAALSVGLEHGVPLVELLRPALGLGFVPTGHTDDPDIPRVRSVVDYAARRLAIDWLPHAQRTALGVFTASELAERSGVSGTSQ
ncbi:MAG: hypothetical protein ACRDNO_18445 [Trebonia sp.]